MKAGKRKLKELLGGDEDDREKSRSPKKRKIKPAKGVKRSTSSASMKMAKGAAKAVKRTVSAHILNARQAVGSKRVIKKTMKASSLKVYGNRKTQISSRNSSLTIVAGDGSPKRGKAKVSSSVGKRSVKKNVVRSVRPAKGGSRGASEGTIRVISVAGEAEK